MSVAQSVLAVNDDLPIRTQLPVHSGKVRSVYWLSPEDSARLIAQKGYDVAPDAPLAVMVISDRISAFDCIWRAEGDVRGVPGKGAALNAISNHWFRLFKARGLADSHILDIPHPFVWIVQKARPVMVEAICRAYITGSMWRAYSKGERDFCGIQLPEGLAANQKLDELLITPSTKGVIRGVAGVPEADDVNVTRQQLLDNLKVFGFRSATDVDLYETLLKQGFGVISEALARAGQLFVDTKFEFGYVTDSKGTEKLIYMDEVGTPDSSRMWDAAEYQAGRIVENSKEGFRQFLLNHFPDPDIMLNKDRFAERVALARDNALPLQSFMDLSNTYTSVAEKITGQPIVLSDNPKAEITQVLADQFDLIK
ncbi:phosphoribosylaminoimidazolesuccinocarboxamide synthase [Simiduia agarivorans]|uniref:Phosphoribosylaminoimidazole-succinocarboxamide synthase n=1 Tax=Simiduia agarivorans (strain DSM 21679 / JCM 13881 / BCRC 17597 / SA1) TaxID=1117647 RepID=K4KMU9_SIMAS|nr:phosphoribosylaminoimidazolesuccinocarboxamide synthase [Simiduia agarivorans]AFV00347.1 phosphoribosylaminoimidazole-succinocarboxamide synthase [Simiduia agarivorans SA1 = DSM 21679]